MRKFQPILALLTIVGFTACKSNPGGLSATTQKNLDAQHAIANCFDTKDFSKIGDYIAADAVDHAGSNGDLRGLDSMKAQYAQFVAPVATMKSEIIKELADDDYVMSWYKFTGTWKNTEMGHRAGDAFEIKSMEIARYKDGKSVEHWALADPAETMKMMAAMQPPMNEAKKDTLKKN
jgi:predicted ester cyclase